MVLRELTRDQICSVYRSYLEQDFPADERRPLELILRTTEAGTYVCLGAFQDDSLVGYAFLVQRQQHYLLDYLAILQPLRGQGLGSQVLQLLAQKYRDADSVITEVEDPAAAQTPEERLLRQRRLQFYCRSGFADPGVCARTFGVAYRLLSLTLRIPCTPEQLRTIYADNYRATLPEAMFRRNIFV